MNELTHEMKLLGLVMPDGDEFCSYFEDGQLPEHFVKCVDFRDIYKLKKSKRKETKENLEPNIGMDLVIHDPGAKKYFYRTLKTYTDLNKLFKYFEDGNLYVLKNEYLPKEESNEIEITPDTENKDDTELIF